MPVTAFPGSKKEKLMVQGMARDQQALNGNDSARSTDVIGKDARRSDTSVIAGGSSATPGNNANPNNNGNHYAYGHYKNTSGGR